MQIRGVDMGWTRRVLPGLMFVALLGSVVGVTTGTVSVSAAPPAGASSFVPVTPTRLVDTRLPSCGCTITGANEFSVQVTGQATVPAGATAAVVTLTMTGASGQGYLSAWPTGGTVPVVSSTNVSKAGQTLANTQIIPLSIDGAMSVYTSVPAFVLVDIVGYFIPAPSGVTAGRYLPTPPLRLIDTRQSGGGGILSAGSVRTYDPRSLIGNVGYSAVAINVTMTGTGGWGFVTAWPSAQSMPTTSTVNADAAGENRAAFTIVPTSSTFSVFAGNSSTHLVIDIVGVFTDTAADTSEEGLFVPVTPTRWFDTRQVGGGGAYGANETRTYAHTGVAPAGSGAIPPDAGSMVGNVTMTGAKYGYVTAYEAGIGLPATSTVNTSIIDSNIANGAIISLSSTGAVAFTSSTVTHLVVDYTGWFTAAPAVVPPDPTRTIGACQPVALDVVNGWRAELARSPLAWSATLYDDSCAWATHLAVLGAGITHEPGVTGEVLHMSGAGCDPLLGFWRWSSGHYNTLTGATRTVGAIVTVTDSTGRCWAVGRVQ